MELSGAQANSGVNQGRQEASPVIEVVETPTGPTSEQRKDALTSIGRVADMALKRRGVLAETIPLKEKLDQGKLPTVAVNADRFDKTLEDYKKEEENLVYLDVNIKRYRRYIGEAETIEGMRDKLRKEASDAESTAKNALELMGEDATKAEKDMLEKKVIGKKQELQKYEEDNVPLELRDGQFILSDNPTPLETEYAREVKEWMRVANTEREKVRADIAEKNLPESEKQNRELRKQLEEVTADREKLRSQLKESTMEVGELTTELANEKRKVQELKEERQSNRESNPLADENLSEETRALANDLTERSQKMKNETDEGKKVDEERIRTLVEAQEQEKVLREQAERERDAAVASERRLRDKPFESAADTASEMEESDETEKRSRGLMGIFGATAAGIIAVPAGVATVGLWPTAIALGAGQSGIRGVQELRQPGRFAELMGKDWGWRANWERRGKSERTGRWANFVDRNRLGRSLAVVSDAWANTEQVAGVGTVRLAENILELGDRFADRDQESIAFLMSGVEDKAREAGNENKTPEELFRGVIRDIFNEDKAELGEKKARIYNAHWLTSVASQLSWDSKIGNYKVYDLLRKRSPNEISNESRENVLNQIDSLGRPDGVVRLEAQRLIGQLEASNDEDDKRHAQALIQQLAESRSIRLNFLKGSYLLSRTTMGAVKAIDVAAIFQLDQVGRGLDWWRQKFFPNTPAPAALVAQPGVTTGAETFTAQPGEGAIKVMERMYGLPNTLEGQRQAWSHITQFLAKPENVNAMAKNPVIAEAIKMAQQPGFNPFSTRGMEVMYKLHWAIGQGARFVKP